MIVLTALVCVAVWSGLHAWTFESRDPEAPRTIETMGAVELGGFQLPRLTVAEEASVTRPTAARGEILARLAVGNTTTDGLRIALIDGRSRRSIQHLAVGTEREFRFEGLPPGDYVLAAHREGHSPLFAYLMRETVSVSADTQPAAPRVVNLELQAFRPKLEITAFNDNGRDDPIPSVVTCYIHRDGDPSWYATPPAPTHVFSGNPVAIDLPELGPGKYRVTFSGFAPEAEVSFTIPGPTLIESVGQLR